MTAPVGNAPIELLADLAPTYAANREDQRRKEMMEEIRQLDLAEQEEEGPGVVKRAGKDIVAGIIESPSAVAHGVAEVLPDAVLAARDIAEFFENRIGTDVVKSATSGGAGGEEFIRRMEAYAESEERTVTGNIIREGVNFMTVFLPLVGQLGKAKWVKQIGEIGKKTKTGVRLTKDMLAGAAADITVTDTARVRLEAMLKEDPTLRGPVEEFLAADPADEAVNARLKMALVGAGLGVLGDGVFLGLKALRASRIAKRELRAELELTEEGIEALRKEQAKSLGVKPEEVRIFGGDPKAPVLKPDEVGKQQLRAARKRIKDAEAEVRERFPALSPADISARAEKESAAIGDFLHQVETTGDTEKLMQDLTDVFAESVDVARRGVQTHEATKKAADLLGLSVEQLLSRRGGQALNDAETIAYQRIWVTVGERVADLADMATGPNATALDKFRFRKGVSLFHAINLQVLGARAEAGRAVQAWRIKVGGNVERARMVAHLLEESGGEEVASTLARAISAANKRGFTPGQMNQLIRGGAWGKTHAVMREWFVLGLLWRPSTHAVNLTSNTIVPLLSVAERALGRGFSKLDGTDAIVAGEAMIMLKAMTAGYQANFHLIAQSISKGFEKHVLRRAVKEIEPPAIVQQSRRYVGEATQKLEERLGALSSDALGVDPRSGLGRAVDVAGQTTRVPGRLLLAEDRFFKTIGFWMELNAQAHRSAVKEGAEKGWDASRTAEKFQELLMDPPEHIRLAAVDNALYQTFTQATDGRAARLLYKFRDIPVVGWFFAPFARTPLNLLRYTFERTPAAPLVGQWSADIAAGGARRDIAMARMALGSALGLVFADWAWEGHVQGASPRDKGIRDAMERQGLQADSLRIGDHTFRINRVDPLGMQLSVSASLSNLIKGYLIEEEDFPAIEEVAAGVGVAISDSVLGKTWFTGISNLVSAMSYPDRYMPALLRRSVTSLLPASSALRTTRDLSNPEVPEYGTMGEALISNIMFLEQRLARRHDLWGHQIVMDVVNVFSPARVKKVTPSPIDQEMIDNGFGIQRIQRRTSFGGADVNFREFPHVYEAYVKLAGNEAKNPRTGLGAEDFLNQLVKEPSFQTLSRGPDGMRASRIRTWVTRYRKLAQAELLFDPQGRYQGLEFQKFRAMVGAGVLEKQALRIRQSPEQPSPLQVPQ